MRVGAAYHEMGEYERSYLIFRATVEIPGGGRATGYGSEGYDDFREYIEKAETKALGRALAALGFGTQFCPDFEFSAGNGRLVDSPIDFASTRGRRRTEQRNAPGEPQTSNLAQPITPRQVNFIQAIAREIGLGESDLEHEAQEQFGKRLTELDRKNASVMIERLQVRRAGVPVTEMAS